MMNADALTPFIVDLNYKVEYKKGLEIPDAFDEDQIININHKFRSGKIVLGCIEYNCQSPKIFHIASTIDRLRNELRSEQTDVRAAAQERLDGRTSLAANFVRPIIFHHLNCIAHFALNLLSACSDALRSEIEEQKRIIFYYDEITRRIALYDKVDLLLKQRTDLLFSYLQIENPTLPQLESIKGCLTQIVRELKALHDRDSGHLTSYVSHNLRPERDPLMTAIDQGIQTHRSQAEQQRRAAQWQAHEEQVQAQRLMTRATWASRQAAQKASWIARKDELHQTWEVMSQLTVTPEQLAHALMVKEDAEALQKELLGATQTRQSDQEVEKAFQSVNSDLHALKCHMDRVFSSNPRAKEAAEQQIRSAAATSAAAGSGNRSRWWSCLTS